MIENVADQLSGLAFAHPVDVDVMVSGEGADAPRLPWLQPPLHRIVDAVAGGIAKVLDVAAANVQDSDNQLSGHGVSFGHPPPK